MRRVPTDGLLVAVPVGLAGCASAVGPVASETPRGEIRGATLIDMVDGDTVVVRTANDTVVLERTYG